MAISSNDDDLAILGHEFGSQPEAVTAPNSPGEERFGGATGEAEGGCSEPNTGATADPISGDVDPGAAAAEADRVTAGEGVTTVPAGEEPEGQEVKKPVSLQKIEANRRNAQKSTGPTSPEGKQRSSWNSTKHGLLGKRLLVTEDAGASEWAHLLESLRQDLKPVGALEELLVEKIAKGYWRLQVADGYEVGMTKSLLEFHISMDKMARYQTAVGRQLARDVADLKRLQQGRKQSDSLARSAEPGEPDKEG